MAKTTGTNEWSDFTYNVGNGCSHNCLYCWAYTVQVGRFMRISPQNWKNENTNRKPSAIPGQCKKGKPMCRAMFPSTHDISPFYLPTVIQGIYKLLNKDKSILLVSKPHLECIRRICTEFADYKDRIAFRFTICTLNRKLAEIWEPGAPTPKERIACLKYALKKGWIVSVSMEPMLSDTDDAIKTFNRLVKAGATDCWIGKMNYINHIEARVKNDIIVNSKSNRTTILEMLAKIRIDQSDQNILKMVDILDGHPCVSWKDSIKNVIAKYPRRKVGSLR